jgi:probable F420-dependent oxidoreductase
VLDIVGVGVQFVYGFPILSCPIAPAWLDPDGIPRVATAAERAGFGAVFLTEHPAPSAGWRSAIGHDALDPFVALACVARETSTLRLLTYVAVVPFRNPFALAKTAATLDLLSGGRLILGVGVGYMQAEFAALGVPFDERNALFDEGLEVLRLAWSGKPVSYSGGHFEARDIVALPGPAQRPHPPIWIAGNSLRARRRVAQHGQGWMPIPVTPEASAMLNTPTLDTIDDLASRITDLRERASAEGRSDDIDVLYILPEQDPFSEASRLVDQLGEMAAAGVTWFAINGQGRDVAEASDLCAWFGVNVIDAIRS